MLFELTPLQRAKLVDIEVLSQKNRMPNAPPGVILSYWVELPNDRLAMFDGFLLGMLYTRNEAGTEAQKQAALDGVEPLSQKPNLTKIGEKIGSFAWHSELTGYQHTIDWGTGGPSDIALADCKLTGFNITPKDGGTFLLKFKVEAAEVSPQDFGKIAGLKSRETQILCTPPVVEGDLTEGGKIGFPFPADEKPAKGRKGVNKVTPEPESDATETHLAAHAPQE